MTVNSGTSGIRFCATEYSVLHYTSYRKPSVVYLQFAWLSSIPQIRNRSLLSRVVENVTVPQVSPYSFVSNFWIRAKSRFTFLLPVIFSQCYVLQQMVFMPCLLDAVSRALHVKNLTSSNSEIQTTLLLLPKQLSGRFCTKAGCRCME